MRMRSPWIRGRGRSVQAAILSVGVCLTSGQAIAQTAAETAAEDPAEASARQLAGAYARWASRLTSFETPTAASYELAILMLEQARSLDPDNEEILRRLRETAAIAERVELHRELTRRLLELAPDDERLQLERISEALSRYQTADELRRAYGKLLTEETIRRLDPAIAGRLAYEYALLLRRIGDVEGFAEWLARATAIDQTNKDAAAMAAGYFAVQEDDPFARGELLVNLLMADPADLETQIRLANHLLEHGAYTGAERMLTLAVKTHEPLGQSPQHNLIADYVLAQWGASAFEDALNTIRAREGLLTRVAQRQAITEDPDIPEEELKSIQATLPTTLAAIRIALLDRDVRRRIRDAVDALRIDRPAVEAGAVDIDPAERLEHFLAAVWIAAWAGADAQEVESLLARVREVRTIPSHVEGLFNAWIALQRLENPELTGAQRDSGREAHREAMAAYTDAPLADRDSWAVRVGWRLLQLEDARVDFNSNMREIVESPDLDDATRREVLLTQAWINLWLGDSFDSIESTVARAAEIEPLEPAMQARYDGWLALRRGDLDRAEEILASHVDQDPVAAHLGLAILSAKRAQNREAAEHFLAVWRTDAGSATGLWARARLGELLDRTPPTSETASRLEELIASVPRTIDRIPTEPTRVAAIRLEPLKQVFQPYEPIEVRVIVRNNSNYPLGIAPDGAIRPKVVVQPRIAVANVRISALKAFVIEIGRRLRLEPHEQMEFVIDLRTVGLRNDAAGYEISRAGVDGASIELKATLNPLLAPNQVLEPGPLGSNFTSRVFRVNGIRATTEWLEQAIGRFSVVDSWQDVVDMALAAEIIVRQSDPIPEELADLIGRAKTSLVEAFARLDPVVQAWLITVMTPRHPSLEGVLQTARRSENRNVQLAYLMYHAGPDDPMIDAAQRGDDPVVKQAGALLSTVRRQQEQLRAAREAEAEQREREQQEQP